MTRTFQEKVDEFLAQRRIAVVGVSRSKSNHPSGHLIYHRLRAMGREVFAVNPSMSTFEGDPCYPELQSISGRVDGAVILTHPSVTDRIVRDCHAAGVRRVWMHRGSGSSVSPAAVDYCNEHDITVLADGCPMMFGPGVDFGHTCLRFYLKLTGGLSS